MNLVLVSQPWNQCQGQKLCVRLTCTLRETSGPVVQKIYPLDKSYPLNKSSSIYTSYPVDTYLSSGYSFEQLGPAYKIFEV
jgi:hypothetical protein